jgi:putative ABC transport system ATP-binding protein
MERVKTPVAKDAVPSLEAVRLDKSFVSGIVQVHVLQGCPSASMRAS